MFTKYEELIRGLALLFGLEPEELLKVEEIAVHGLSIGLQFEGDADAGDVVFYAPLGEPAPEHASALYPQLLQANHLWAGTGGATLSVHPASGEVILMGRLPLERLQAEHFVQVLDVFTDAAVYWRDRIRTDLTTRANAAPDPNHLAA